MRIDLFNTAASEISSEPNSKQIQSPTVPSTETSDSGDRTTLTSGSGTVGALVSEAMSSPQIRQDKVQSLQQAVSSGKYQIEPDKIAGAMIDEHA
ncbi:MAG TPA: flagellar biosynthesis anti-sigma factor FlgM [Terracidiphilus sp.]|jgi:negative regulator of flagellin synthesis FlgM